MKIEIGYKMIIKDSRLGCAIIMFNHDNPRFSEIKAFRTPESEFSELEKAHYIKIACFSYDEFMSEGRKGGDEWYRNALNTIFQSTETKEKLM